MFSCVEIRDPYKEAQTCQWLLLREQIDPIRIGLSNKAQWTAFLLIDSSYYDQQVTWRESASLTLWSTLERARLVEFSKTEVRWNAEEFWWVKDSKSSCNVNLLPQFSFYFQFYSNAYGNTREAWTYRNQPNGRRFERTETNLTHSKWA